LSIYKKRYGSGMEVAVSD